MLAKEAFLKRFENGAHLLDCATGTTLMKAGMQRGCCMAEWVLLHPEVLVALQKACAEAGSEIIYAPTFQAQPVALAAYGLEHQTETINEMLAALSRKATPECLIAGNMTTLRGFMDTANEANLEQQIGEYRRQIRALVNGGTDGYSLIVNCGVNHITCKVCISIDILTFIFFGLFSVFFFGLFSISLIGFFRVFRLFRVGIVRIFRIASICLLGGLVFGFRLFTTKTMLHKIHCAK